MDITESTPLVVLSGLIQSAEEHEIEVSVSVLVSGTWITGLLTSTRKYLDAVASQFADSSQATEGGEGFVNGVVESLRDKVVPALLDIPPEGRAVWPVLHLRRATFATSVGAQVEECVLAIRLDRVDAVLLGSWGSLSGE